MCKLAQIISTLRLLNYAYCDACNPFFFPIAQRLFRRFSWGDFTLYVRLVSDELLETLTKNPKKLVAKSRLDCSRTTEAPIGKNQSPRCFFKSAWFYIYDLFSGKTRFNKEFLELNRAAVSPTSWGPWNPRRFRHPTAATAGIPRNSWHDKGSNKE